MAIRSRSLARWAPILVSWPLATTATAASATAEPDDDNRLQEIVVTSGLHAERSLDLPASVSVLSADALAGHTHFEDVIAQVPNLNWAGDTARPRYFQIRGIGELEQYQGAPNPSVGFLIDDIDFSGLGTAATLFDVDHIEVLHGPQAVIYGASALAGLISVQSAAPSDTFGARVELDAGDYDSRSYGAMVTGPMSALDSAFRLAVQKSTGNGFYHNAYLGRSDTDERGELTVRGRWHYHPNEQVNLDLSVLRVQIDDGYDAFSIDNTRTTQSDQPGVDRQYSTGVSAHLTCACLGGATFTAIGTYANTNVTYSYDGDWGNPVLWAPYTYQYTETQQRHRSTRSAEARVSQEVTPGFSWLVGVYAFELRETLGDTNLGIYDDPSEDYYSNTLSVLSSGYRSRSGAVYAQLDGDLAPGLKWSAGVRGERRTARYDDSTTNLDAPTTTQDFRPGNDMWGGHLSVDYALDEGQHVYGLVSRGFKAGGFNLSDGLPASQKQFGPESVLNFEAGHKLHAGTVQLDTSLFYMRRQSPQLKTGEQLTPGDPNSFIFYTGNARSGYNYGLESALTWAAAHSLELGGSLGLLQTRYEGFVQDGVVLPGRAQPHAPDWQVALDATWRDARGPFARLDVTGMGSFFYDLPPNDTRSNAYALVHAKLGWQSSRYEIYVWGRNLLDKNYTVRGFYFGDEPPDFPNKLYVQLGEPRNWGVHFTARY